MVERRERCKNDQSTEHTCTFPARSESLLLLLLLLNHSVMSDSVRPCRRQPTRLLHLTDLKKKGSTTALQSRTSSSTRAGNRRPSVLTPRLCQPCFFHLYSKELGLARDGGVGRILERPPKIPIPYCAWPMWGSYVLGWPKMSFRFFYHILRKNLSELFGQPNMRWDLTLVIKLCWKEGMKGFIF